MMWPRALGDDRAGCGGLLICLGRQDGHGKSDDSGASQIDHGSFPFPDRFKQRRWPRMRMVTPWVSPGAAATALAGGLGVCTSAVQTTAKRISPGSELIQIKPVVLAGYDLVPRQPGLGRGQECLDALENWLRLLFGTGAGPPQRRFLRSRDYLPGGPGRLISYRATGVRLAFE